MAEYSVAPIIYVLFLEETIIYVVGLYKNILQLLYSVKHADNMLISLCQLF